MRLSEKSIRKLAAPEKGNRIYYDDEILGLGLRVTAKGARAFVMNYRIERRERRLTIGRHPEWSATAARERARELRREIDLGIDPLGRKQDRRAEPTFGEVVTEYLATDAAQQKSRDAYARILRVDVLPHWGNMRLSEIRRVDVMGLIERKAQSAPIGANRVFELLRRIFNTAVRRDLIAANPCSQIRKPGLERSRDRVLSADELRTLWPALDGPHFSESTGSALRLVLLSAQRPGEVATMEWDEVDAEGRFWQIPARKAKNGRSHRVPLNAIAWRTLEALPRVGPYVFASPKDGQPIHRNALALAVRRSRDKKRCEKLNRPLLSIEPFSPHDLRRTAATHMTAAGVEPFTVRRILNHAEAGPTSIYDRYSYDAEKRKALDKLGSVLKKILSGDRGKVVEFAQG